MALEELVSFEVSELVIMMSLELLSSASSDELEVFVLAWEELLANETSELLSGGGSGLAWMLDELICGFVCSVAAELVAAWDELGIEFSMKTADELSVEQAKSPARQVMQKGNNCRNRFFFIINPIKNTIFTLRK